MRAEDMENMAIVTEKVNKETYQNTERKEENKSHDLR
jgi:hypothetical protein